MKYSFRTETMYNFFGGFWNNSKIIKKWIIPFFSFKKTGIFTLNGKLLP